MFTNHYILFRDVETLESKLEEQSCNYHLEFESDKIKGDEMCEENSTHDRNDNCTQNFVWKTSREENTRGQRSVRFRLILKCCLMRM
jgi:hypothetical protein